VRFNTSILRQNAPNPVITLPEPPYRASGLVH
jgi:hypothetical protein